MHTLPKARSDAVEMGSTTRESQLSASQSVIENAKDAAKMAIDVLSVVAEATASVPYLGAISKALAAFKEVLDEVSVCKEDCRATINDADEFRELILKFEAKWVQLESGGEDELWKALTEFGRAVLDCIETLRALKVDSSRRRDRFKLIFKRNEVHASVIRCRDTMRIAKEKFNMMVALDTNHLVREIHQRSQLAIAPPGNTLAAESVWRLRAANAIFYGRESEVAAAVDLIVNHAPARVAILGPGGIGKTSIALAVLHDPRVKELFGDRRCFMSCEATTTADAVVRVLADALNIVVEKGSSFESDCHQLISHLRACSGIICLDNLETPLDADKLAVEQFLNEMASLPSIAMLITSRDTSMPAIRWTSPHPSYIRPLSLEAALATWDDICEGHDEYAMRLVTAVDCMPLAVNLLARVTSVEGSAKDVWIRWKAEGTDLIQIGSDDHRLLSVGASIELSFRSLSRSEGVIDVLGIFCIFSRSLNEFYISILDEAFKEHLSVRRAVTLLKRLSLVYTIEDQGSSYSVNVLSPVRHHMRKHHISDELFLELLDVVMKGNLRQGLDDPRDEILDFGFKRPGPCRERCVDIIISSPGSTMNVELLNQAIEKSRTLEPRTQLGLLRMRGSALLQHKEYDMARSSYLKVIELDEQVGSRSDLFRDWTEWIFTFLMEFVCYEERCPSRQLDDVQNAIQKAWDLGRNEYGIWDGSFVGYQRIADAQHFVNKCRRLQNMPVLHRSGMYSDNDSRVALDFERDEAVYYRLSSTSPPPWDLSLILETMATFPPSSSRDSACYTQ